MTFPSKHHKKPVLFLTGLSGKIGRVLAPFLAEQYQIIALERTKTVSTNPSIRTVQGDLADLAGLERLVKTASPAAFLHLGALSQITSCRNQESLTELVNVRATVLLAGLAAKRGSKFIFSSTDMVFPGKSDGYKETDQPRPLTTYGTSKWQAEQQLLAVNPAALIFRFSLNYGTCFSADTAFFCQMYQQLLLQQPLHLFTDERRNMLYTPDVAPLIVAGLASDKSGIYHVGGSQSVSRFQFGEELAHQLGADPQLLIPSQVQGNPCYADRSPDLSLSLVKLAGDFPQISFKTPAQGIASFLHHVGYQKEEKNNA